MSLVQQADLLLFLFFFITVKEIFNCNGRGPSAPQTYLYHISVRHLRHSLCAAFYTRNTFILPSSRCVHIQVKTWKGIMIYSSIFHTNFNLFLFFFSQQVLIPLVVLLPYTVS